MNREAPFEDGFVVRTGLFGGTFNPVHWGHLRSAEEVREMFNLERVIFIPTNISPHKEPQELVSPHHRLAMLNLALEGNPFFETSDIELKRAGKSYSIETVNHFKQTMQGHFTPFFIVGVDVFMEISTWKQYEELFSLCNFIVMTRPRYAIKELGQLLPHGVMSEFSCCPGERRFMHRSRFSIYLAEITAIDISSQAIRTQVKNGRSITYLLPRAVESYIGDHALYAC